MKNQLTHHAQKRLQQRGIRNEVISCLEKYGHSSFATGGAIKVILTKRSRNRIISELKNDLRWLEKTTGVVYIAKEGHILTGYRTYKQGGNFYGKNY